MEMKDNKIVWMLSMILILLFANGMKVYATCACGGRWHWESVSNGNHMYVCADCGTYYGGGRTHSPSWTTVSTSSTCMKCSICGLTLKHNSSGGHCSNAHCAYHSSKTLCSRSCKHYKWTSCKDHSYSSAWSRNDTHHWHRCKVTSSCSSKKSYGVHVDSNSDSLCDVCEGTNNTPEDSGGGGGGDNEVTESPPGAPVVTVNGTAYSGNQTVYMKSGTANWTIETKDSILNRPLQLTEYSISGDTVVESSAATKITRAGRFNKSGTTLYAQNWTDKTIPSSHTIEFWIYVPMYHQGTSYIFHTCEYDNSFRNNQLHLHSNGYFYVRTSLADAPSTGKNRVTFDNLTNAGFYKGWAYVSVQIESGKKFSEDGARIWINGAEVEISDKNTSSTHVTQKLRKEFMFIGGYYRNTNLGLPDGSMMKEFKILSGLHGETSSQRMYKEMVSGVSGYSNLIAYWPMTEVTGSTAYTGMASGGKNAYYASDTAKDPTKRNVSSYYSAVSLDPSQRFSGTISNKGHTTITASHVGMSGATTDSIIDVWIDDTLPSGEIYTDSNAINTSTVKVYVNAVDDGAGVKSVSISAWTGKNTKGTYSTTKTATYDSENDNWYAIFNFADIVNTSSNATNNGETTYYFDAAVTDNPGNTAKLSPIGVIYDATKPTVSADNVGYPNDAIIKLKDTNSGIAYWGVTTSTTSPSTTNNEEQLSSMSTLNTWQLIGSSTAEITATFSGLSTGTYYAWGKDNAGNYNYVKFEVKNMTISGSVTITGTNRYQSTLTATVSGLNPSDASLSYKWYYADTKVTTGGTAISGATSSTYTVGSGLAGKYIYVVVTATKTDYETAYFRDVTDGTVEKIIKTIPTLSGTYTYNGKTQYVTINNYDSTYMTVTGNSGIDANTYTATFSLKDTANYKWNDANGTSTNKTATWTIAKKTLTVSWTTPTTFVYNGSEQAPTPSVTGVNGEQVNLSWTKGIDVGDYTSTASLLSVTGGRAKTTNYVLGGSNSPGYSNAPKVDFKITQAPGKIDLTEATLELVEGTTKNIKFTYTGDGTLSAKSNGTGIATVGTITTTTLPVTGVTPGTTTVTISATAGKNYTAASTTVTVKVYEKPNVALTPVSTNNIKFNGWILNGATVSSDVLTLDANGETAEKWFLVDGNKWNLGIKFMATSDVTKRALNVTTTYYNSSFTAVASQNGSSSNTWNPVGTYNTDTYNVWDGDAGYGSNVKYVKVTLKYSDSYTASPLKVSEVTFNSGIDDNYTGMRISSSANLGSIASVKYLWSKSASGVTESQITNTTSNGSAVYPKYGAQGTYYLWTLVTDSTGGKTIKTSEAIIIDNPEIELSVPSEAWASNRTINIAMFNAESVYDNSEMTAITKGATTSEAYVSGPKGTVASATSRFNGGKAWLLTKTGTNTQYHGTQNTVSALNGLVANSYVLVSSNYKTTSAAGIAAFETPTIRQSDWSKTYSTTQVSKALNITADGNEHHVYYLLKLNEAITTDALLSSGMPNWGYSTQTGSMTVDGLQWFVFNSKADMNTGVAVKKYAFGDYDAQYFRTNGTAFTEDTITVTENGTYTFYMKTTNGTERIRKIVIRNLDKIPPTVNVDLSGYIEGQFTGDDVTAIVNGTDAPAGVQNIEYSLDNSRWYSILPTTNNNLLANGDFGKTSSTSVGWDTTRNGNIMADSWTGYQSSVSTSSTGYHVHMNTATFDSNVLEFKNQNSEVGLSGRELYVTTPVQANLKTGTSYTLSFDVYAENDGMKITGGLYYSQSGTNGFHSGQMDITTADGEVGHWIRKTYTFRTSTTAGTSGTIYIYGHEGVEGTFYIKNVKLEENGTATEWTPMNTEQTVTKKKGVIRFDESMDTTVYFRVTDNAGNVTTVTKVIRIDKDKPVISSVKLNNGATSTKNVEVIVETIVDDAQYIYVSNTNVAPTRDQWVEFSKYYKHKLTTGNGSKTVYVWCKDSNGNVSDMVSANIKLEVTYKLTLTCNQWYSGWKNYEVTYLLKTASGSWQEEESNVFTGLLPDTVYHVKTKIVDEVGISEESEELIFKVVFNSNGKLVLEVQ